MIKLRLPLLGLFVFIFTSCAKVQQGIDVSQQTYVDYNGNYFGGSSLAGQWESTEFSSAQKNLFKALDTADLGNTSKPDSVISAAQFPNPFPTAIGLIFVFNPWFAGKLVLKYVIVDSHLNIKDQGVVRIKGNPNLNYPLEKSVSDMVQLTTGIPNGKYRLYATLSAAGSPDFYQTWGNIQKGELIQ